MTHQIKKETDNHYPIRSKHFTYQPLKLYSLYKKDSNGRWHRVSEQAYSEKLAYWVFTQRMLENPLNFSIRPIRITSFEAK